MSAHTIEDALKKYDKRYYQYHIDEKIINGFGSNLLSLVNGLNKAVSQGENEEYFKNLINRFLKKSLYLNSDYEFNTSKRIDSTIRINEKLLAIMEVKKPNNKTEMSYLNDINHKALHEIVFYYLQETRDVSGAKVKRKSDVEIRRLLITDTFNWILIDSNEIEKLCDGYLENLFFKYENRQLIYSNNSEKFYEDIKHYFNSIDVDNRLPYVFFNINDYKKQSKWSQLYKILYKTFLLKEGYKQEMSFHVLNDKFYQELLYIMGLHEVKHKSNVTIEIDHSIKNSLADQVYQILTLDKEYDEYTSIDKTFELVIIWMNRLLFIKLFEGQLISFNGESKEYHILDNDKIKNFQDIQDLFFEVLGKKQRSESVFINQFSRIPYLNSSLFEKYEIEKKDVNIKELNNKDIIKKRNSITGNKVNNELPIIEYIIDFLNSYSFSSQISKNNNIIESKDIIDASVLGLIFEKLNGYKDGSYYTPSVITEYMCMQSIERIVIEKINDKYSWSCNDLFEIKAKVNNSLNKAREINSIINSIKICDISVGSGHFLVSALNRMILIKKQLGILFKFNSNELLTEYEIDIMDDVLQVYDGQGIPFKYNMNDHLSQQVQETLFNEKRIIIENCLFGVDLNSKAVSICQLRLWIELLKSAYYKYGVMETLPNIDINIKVGNSLINKLDFEIGTKIDLNQIKTNKLTTKLVDNYKDLVKKYKVTSDKQQKLDITNKIIKLKNELHNVYSQISFFTNEKNEIVYDLGEDSKIYKDAFEWAIEFPELLNKKGIFDGFDCIVGNPPYGLLNKKQNQNTSISVNKELLDYYKNLAHYAPAKGGVLNIYRLFICRCFMLLKESGHCCLIFPLAFMCDLSASNIRKYLMENTMIDFIEAFPERDNENKRVFKEVKMSVCILGATKKKVSSDYKFNVRIHYDKFVDENNETMKISYNDICKIDNSYNTIPLITQRELRIFLNMTSNCERLSEYSKCYTGEIDITLDKKYITSNNEDNLMIRGAQVQKYKITNDISQGEILYLKADKYLHDNKGERSQHHKKRRIVMQGITGVNEKWRLKMTILEPPCFCANSVNYLIINSENDFIEYILGVLNSKLLNWFFSKISTNSNVNGYEIDGLPIKLGNSDQYNKIVSLVKKLLENNFDDKIEMLNQKIDEIVYSIYGINDYDVPIIEG